MQNDWTPLCAEHHRQATRKSWLRWICDVASLLLAIIIIIAVFLPLVLDAMEREQQWRADRLCHQGYYCAKK